MPIRKHSSRKLSGGRRRSGRKLSGGRRRRRSGRRLSGGKDCPEGKVLNPKTNRCIKRGGRVYNALFGPDAKKPAAPKESAVKKPAAPKSSKKPAAKPAAKKKKKSLASKEELRKLFETSVASEKDKDWDAFYKALNALYRDKFNLKKDDTYYIASVSKQLNRPAEPNVIDSDDDKTAFPVFLDLTHPYKKRDAARAAAEDFIGEIGELQPKEIYKKMRFETGDLDEEINTYVNFLF